MADDATSAPVTITLALGAETPFTETLDMLVRVTNDREMTAAFWTKTDGRDDDSIP